MAFDVGTVYVNVRPDLTGFQSDLQTKITPLAASASRTISSKFASAGRGLSTFGRSMTRYVSLPLGLAGAASVKLATDFDQAMRNVNSLLELSAPKFEEMSDAVLDLSTKTPQAADVLAKGLYNIASSGFAGADALKVLKASATAASAGLTDTDVASRAIVATLNAYGEGANQAAENSDILFQGVNVGVQTFDELANSIGTYIGAASQLAVPLEDVVGAQAAMTLTGISASEAAVSLNGIFKTLLKPSQDLTAVLKENGFETGQAALQQEGLQGVMELLTKEVGNNKGRWVELFPEIRAARGAMALASDDGDLLSRTMDKMAGSVGAASRVFEEQAKGPAFQFQIAMNKLKKAGIDLGNQLIPIITDKIIPVIEDMVEWFGKLSPEAVELGIKLGGLALVAGPLLSFAGALLKVTSALTKFVPAATAAEGATAGGIGGAALAGGATVAGLAARDAASIFQGFQEGGGDAAAAAGLQTVIEKLGAINVLAPSVAAEINKVLNPEEVSDVDSFETGVERIRSALIAGNVTLAEARNQVSQLAEEFNVGLPGGAHAFAQGIAFMSSAMRDDLIPTFHEATGLSDDERTNIIRLANTFTHLGGELKGATKAHILEAAAVGDGARAVRLFRNAIRGLDEDQNRGAKAAENHANKVKFLKGALDKVPGTYTATIHADTSSADASVAAFERKMAVIQQTTYTAHLQLIQGGAPPGGQFGAYVPGAASGGFVHHPQLIQVGERHRSEMILPLEDPHGRKALAEAMAAAGGGGRLVIDSPVQLTIDGYSFDAHMRTTARSEIDGERTYRKALHR